VLNTCSILRTSSHRNRAAEILRLPTADQYLLSSVHIDCLDFAFGIDAVLCILAVRKQADGMQNLPPGFISLTAV
jgi:hypothetical protein